MSGTTGAIVVGAGGGHRMGGVEKAFLPLLGRPMLSYSIEAFERSPDVDMICLVLSPAGVTTARAMVGGAGWSKVSHIVPGGETRQESVRTGLEALYDTCEWVLVHDAARPLVDSNLIARGLAAAGMHGAAVPAVAVRDTIKRARHDGEQRIVIETVDRSQLWAAQTPQVFATRRLREAFAVLAARASTFTDDSSLVEAAGGSVTIFDGEEDNVKVTYPPDVDIVEALLRRRGVTPA